MNFKRMMFNFIIMMIIATILSHFAISIYMAVVITYGIANTLGHIEGKMGWFE